MSSRQLTDTLRTTAITIVWEVEDIWNLNFEGSTSSYFFLSQHRLYLCVRRYERSIGIYLCRDDKSLHVLRVFCKVCLIDHHGQERLLREKEIVTEKGKDQALMESLMVEELQKEKLEILPDNTLTISCAISSSYKINLMKRGEIETVRPILRFETLSSELERLYDAHLCCDAILKVENEEFPVHTSILSARSTKMADVFNSVASSSLAHIQRAPVPISGIKASTLKDVLYYIYTGKIRGLTIDTAADLYAAAKQFCLQELKSSCQKVLQTQLTTENIFRIADLAYTHDDQFLKQEIERFIVANVDKVIKSSEWKEFSSEKYVFANDILTSVLLQMQKRNAK